MPAPSNVIELLQTMVRIDSVNAAVSGRADAEGPLRDTLEQIARSWGFATRRLPSPSGADQLLVLHEPAPGGPWLLFDSHLDTVAVNDMTVDPFGAHIDRDKLYGRGACDTKGTGAAMLWALRVYASAGARPNNIALLFSVDEEVGMTGIRSFVEHDLPALPFRPVAAIVGEPTDAHPVVAHNGCVRWTVTTIGRAAHSSVPHEGRSAISAMVRVIDAIESRYVPSLKATHTLTGQAVCSVNLIRGGASINIIPPTCEIGIDRRLVPGEDETEASAALESLLAPLGVEYRTERDILHPPLSDAHNRELAEVAREVLRAMGLPTMTVGAPFATHAAYLAQAGLPTIVLGPGEPWAAHTKDEFVHVSKIERGVDLYRRLMEAAYA